MAFARKRVPHPVRRDVVPHPVRRDVPVAVPPNDPWGGKPRRKAALDRIVEAVIYLQTESRRLAREQAGEYGLTPTQLSVVKLIDAIGSLSLSALSARIRAHNSTVTGIVDRMERDELVVRERDARDRRVWTVRLTERGRRVARQVSGTPWETLKRALASLPAAEQDRLLEIMHRLAKAIEREVQNGTRR